MEGGGARPHSKHVGMHCKKSGMHSGDFIGSVLQQYVAYVGRAKRLAITTHHVPCDTMTQRTRTSSEQRARNGPTRHRSPTPTTQPRRRRRRQRRPMPHSQQPLSASPSQLGSLLAERTYSPDHRACCTTGARAREGTAVLLNLYHRTTLKATPLRRRHRRRHRQYLAEPTLTPCCILILRPWSV